MKNKFFLSIVILFTVSLLLPACRSNDYFTGLDIDPDHVNSVIELQEITPNTTYTNGMMTFLQIQNNSDSVVAFSGDYGIHIYQQINNDWEPVENHTTYGDSEIFLATQEDYPVGRAVLLMPSIEGLAQTTIIRIVVSGIDGNNDLVAATIDLELQP